MKTEIIVAIITGCVTVLSAIITGIFALFKNKSKRKGQQNIKGNGNIQAGENVSVSGGISINVETNNKRKQ